MLLNISEDSLKYIALSMSGWNHFVLDPDNWASDRMACIVAVENLREFRNLVEVMNLPIKSDARTGGYVVKEDNILED